MASYFFKRLPSPLPCPQRLTNPMRHKAARVVPLGPTCYLYALNLCPFALWGAASVVRSLVDVGKGRMVIQPQGIAADTSRRKIHDC